MLPSDGNAPAAPPALAVAAGGQGIVNDAICIAHLLEMAGELLGDLPQLFGRIVNRPDQVAPVLERLIAHRAGDGN